MKKLLMLATVALITAAPAAQAQKKMTSIKVTQAVASFSFLPLYYAKNAGIYAAEGLDVQQIATRGGGPDLVALMSGDVQFNVGAGTYQIGAIRQKRKIVLVYNYYNRNLIQIVMSNKVQQKLGIAPSAPLKQRLAALKGLRLGMTRPGALTDFQWRHLLREGGLTTKDAKIVGIGGGAALLAAMERGQIDAYAISPPIDLMGISRGLGVMWINNAAGDDPSMDPFMFQSVVTTEEYARKNPEIVKAFVRATRNAVNEITSRSAEEVFKVVRNDFKKLKPELAIAAIKSVVPAFNKKGDVTLDMARNVMKMTGTKDVKPEQLFGLFTPDYL
jgi:ABC-type nitrate/sulfonate/bicarbonate transport system substrate-binding protein